MIGGIFNGSTLKSRTMKGGAVALAGFGAAQIIRLASNLVMTRLLAPDAFGLMGVTIALFTWIGLMSDLGLDASIVRSKNGENADFLATARTMALARSCFIAVILVIAGLSLPGLAAAGAFPETSVYADPRLPVFLYAIAASIIITGFSAMRIALHNRKLDLVPVIRLELITQISGIIAMIVAATVFDLGAYSLAAGAVFSELVKTTGSFWALKGPPARFGFSREHFNEIFGYGKWLLIASTFGFLVQRGDQLIFGYLFPISSYALYSIATIWIFTARNVLDIVQRRVANPALAELHRERAHDLTRIYRRLRLAYEAAVIALFLGIVFCADFVIRLVYTPEYHGVAHYMKLLAVMLLLTPYRLLSSVTLTGGDSKRFTWVTIIPGLALVIGAPLVFHFYGEDAAIVFAALAPLAAQPFNWKFASGFVKIDYARECVMAVIAITAAALLLLYA